MMCNGKLHGRCMLASMCAWPHGWKESCCRAHIACMLSSYLSGNCCLPFVRSAWCPDRLMCTPSCCMLVLLCSHERFILFVRDTWREQRTQHNDTQQQQASCGCHAYLPVNSTFADLMPPASQQRAPGVHVQRMNITPSVATAIKVLTLHAIHRCTNRFTLLGVIRDCAARADSTMEVLEVHEANGGRDPFPVFIGRGPMPRPAGLSSGFAVTKRVDRRACYTPVVRCLMYAALWLHACLFLLYQCVGIGEGAEMYVWAPSDQTDWTRAGGPRCRTLACLLVCRGMMPCMSCWCCFARRWSSWLQSSSVHDDVERWAAVLAQHTPM